MFLLLQYSVKCLLHALPESSLSRRYVPHAMKLAIESEIISL